MNHWLSIIALGVSGPRNSTRNRSRSGEMNKSRSYFKLLEALKKPQCPICKLVLEDSRTYLDHLLYELVLDVPMRMTLMESFGFCSWHVHQIPTLPAICAPSMGFSIFASDLLRKLDYVGRAMAHDHRRKWAWKPLFRKARTLISLIKKRPCPACEHVKQFESYHLNELIDAMGDDKFLDAYKASQGICLPHFFLLEETCSSHANFSTFFEVQLAKATALRNTLEEFIRKQDYRFRDQITPEEATSWKTAMEILTGKLGIFANEMGHDLSQRSRRRAAFDENLALGRTRSDSYGLGELFSELKTSKQVTLCLKKPLPADLLDRLSHLSRRWFLRGNGRNGRGLPYSLDIVGAGFISSAAIHPASVVTGLRSGGGSGRDWLAWDNRLRFGTLRFL